MSDQSERLRRMTEYGWHMARADREREQAALAADATAQRLHDELALLHENAAAGLGEAWRRWNDWEEPEREPERLRAYGWVLASIEIAAPAGEAELI
jgi:hypothetical protein